MKCDELKRRHINEVMDMHNLTRGEMGFSIVYYADDVDAAIEELKAEIESLKASHYAEMVDAGMRERRLRRALWLARAERAKEKQQLFHFSLAYYKLCIDGFYNPYSGRRELSPNKWIKVFNKVESKCRAKAEEYK